jgi:hypothetical protein
VDLVDREYDAVC